MGYEIFHMRAQGCCVMCHVWEEESILERTYKTCWHSSGGRGSLNVADKQQMSQHYNGFAIMIPLGSKKLILTLYFNFLVPFCQAIIHNYDLKLSHQQAWEQLCLTQFLGQSPKHFFYLKTFISKASTLFIYCPFLNQKKYSY